MGWIRLDDHIHESDKMEEVGPVGGWMHVCALAYCNRNLTDGVFKKHRALRLGTFDALNPEHVDMPKRLVAAGLWHESGHDCEQCPQGIPQDSFYIHDYLVYQPSRESVEAKRVRDAERKVSQRKATERQPDGRFTSRKSGVQADSAADTTRDSEVESHRIPTQPNPSIEEEEPEFLEQVWRILVNRTLEVRVGDDIADMAKWENSVRASLVKRHRNKIDELLADDPSLAPAEVAQMLQPVRSVKPPPNTERPRDPPLARPPGPRPECQACDSTMWTEQDDGTAIPCKQCQEKSA